MKKDTLLFMLWAFSLLSNIQLLTKPNIKILCTAALIPNAYLDREQQYIHSLSIFKKHGLSVYMVESCQQGPTNLDLHCDNICYTKTQLPEYAYGVGNYGINEALSLAKGLEYFAFDDEDIIIKFTGRYEFKDTSFLNLVNKNLDADVVARIWSNGDVYTALFAIKAKYFKDFLNTIDYNAMKNGKNLEHCFGKYIAKLQKEGKNIVPWDRIPSYLPTWQGSRS